MRAVYARRAFGRGTLTMVDTSAAEPGSTEHVEFCELDAAQ